MITFWALLKDSFRQTLDNKIFIILTVFAAILLSFFFWLIMDGLNALRNWLVTAQDKITQTPFVGIAKVPLEVLYWILPKMGEFECVTQWIQLQALTKGQLKTPLLKEGVRRLLVRKPVPASP